MEALGELIVADVVSRHALKPYDDLTAVAWSERLERLLVIAESADRLLVVTPEGAIDADEALPFEFFAGNLRF